MKANELRIGNRIRHKNENGIFDLKVIALSANSVTVAYNGEWMLDENSIEPISLTEDILRKCKELREGKSANGQTIFRVTKSMWEIGDAIEHWEETEFNEDCFFIYGLGTFNYLHELQNWYFMKEKKELEVVL